MWIFRRFRAVFALTALVALTACTSWQAYEMGPTPSQLPSSVRVTLRAGEQMTLVRPRILGDTLLVGRLTRHGPENWVVPLSRIQVLEAKRLEAGKTVGLVLLTAMVAGLAGYIAYAHAVAH